MTFASAGPDVTFASAGPDVTFAVESVQSSSLLLYVHRDRKEGRGAQEDGHLDFHTAPELSAESVSNHGA